MNKLTIIGNLTRDPVLRVANTTNGQVSVCSFSVAVNDKRDRQKVDYFNVTVWRQLGEVCSKYLAKGRKVCVIGPVGARMYTAQDGSQRVALEVTAEDVEFLSSSQDNTAAAPAPYPAPAVDAQSGYQQVSDEELPF